MDTKDAALVGILIPIFLVVEEITLASPIPIAIFLVYLFRDAKLLTIYAWSVATFISIIISLTFFIGNLYYLSLFTWAVINEGIFIWYIIKQDFNFSKTVLRNIGISWIIIPVVLLIFMMPINTWLMVIRLIPFNFMVFLGLIGVIGIFSGFVFERTFNIFKCRVLDKMSNGINEVLVKFLDNGTGLLYLEINEVNI